MTNSTKSPLKQFGWAKVMAALAATIASSSIVSRRRHVNAAAPEFRTLMTWIPLVVNNQLALAIGRRMFSAQTAAVQGVNVEERLIGDVRCFVYQACSAPQSQVLGATGAELRGALLWIHGGGMILGHAGADHLWCSRLARDAGVVVVSVDYRLAPENPFPAGLEDCYKVLAWLASECSARNVAPTRIAVGGASAGGGLAAALAQLARDRNEMKVAFQLLAYPMLDDRTVHRRDHQGRGHLVWTPASNRYAWTCYLGRAPGPAAPPYAAAARCVNLAGLPPAWVGVGDLDLFYDEDLEYARRLREAGVSCDLHVVAKMPHASDIALDGYVESMTDFRHRMVDAVARAVGRSAN